MPQSWSLRTAAKHCYSMPLTQLTPPTSFRASPFPTPPLNFSQKELFAASQVYGLLNECVKCSPPWKLQERLRRATPRDIHLRSNYKRVTGSTHLGAGVLPFPPLKERKDLKKFPSPHSKLPPILITHTTARRCRHLGPLTHQERGLQGFLSQPSRDLLLAATGRSLLVW